MENFIEALRWLFIESFTSGYWNEVAVGVLMWILCLGLLFLVGWGLFYLFDSVGLQRIKSYGRVIEKRFIESHTTTTMVYNAATKSTMPMVIHHPDSWVIKVVFNKTSDEINVSEGDYVKIKHNTDVPIEYTVGRISGKSYLKSISA